jgi:anti-sigma factor RsiW
MVHDVTEIAGYVAGELPDERLGEFERHLVGCEDCAAEVRLGTTGRQLARLALESAPPELRVRVAALAQPRRRPRRSTVLGFATAAAVVAVALPEPPPQALAAAVADYQAQRPPGGVPVEPAPNLAPLGLAPTAAGVVRLASRPVTVYAYRDGAGQRLLIYVSPQPFMTPAEAREYGGNDAWLSEIGGVSVLCSKSPHETMVVGRDEKQVKDTADFLDLS